MDSPASEEKPIPAKRSRGPKSRCNMVHSLEDLKSAIFWRAVLSECLATSFLVFIGCGSVTGWGNGYAPTIVQISFTFGLTLAVLIWCFGECSGCHVNPAVSIAMMLTRKISIVKGLLYMAAQCVGGIMGAAFVMGITPSQKHGTLGAPTMNPDLTPAQGFGTEFLLTFFLVFTVFAMVDEKRNQAPSAALAIGLVVVATHLMGIKYTGANMNPARTLGPCILSNHWNNHWIYWCGPLLGGIVAGFLYDNLFAANASLHKTRDYMLAANYDNSKYSKRNENYISVDDKEDMEDEL